MNSPDSELLSTLVRMITPMRREFGHTLDVEKFFTDRPYALEVIRTARASEDLRLREYVAYLEGKWLGPRNSVSTGVPGVPFTRETPDRPAVATAEQPQATSAAEMRAKVLAKYKSGLR